MSDEKSDEGRVVYSRPGEAGGGGRRRARRWMAGGGGDTLWGALVPLSVGFALLVGLVFALGVMSGREVGKTSFDTRDDERRLSLMSSTLLNLRMALGRLDSEARIRARVEAGTGNVMLPPSDLRLRNERGEVEKLLPEFDKLQFKDAAKKRAVREGIDAYLATTKNLDVYSREGVPAYRDLDERLRSLMSELSDERTTLAERRNGYPPRLVYQGTVSMNGGHYDLRGIFGAIVGEGLSLDVYPSRNAPAYAELARRLPGLRVHATLSPPRLLAALPQYDFGWAGFNSALNGAHLDTCLPNKAYEYMGCGLPVLTLGHRALARLVGEGYLGLSLATLDDLLGQLLAVDLVELRRRIAAARLELTVEANIGRLAELYEAAVG